MVGREGGWAAMPSAPGQDARSALAEMLLRATQGRRRDLLEAIYGAQQRDPERNLASLQAASRLQLTRRVARHHEELAAVTGRTKRLDAGATLAVATSLAAIGRYAETRRVLTDGIALHPKAPVLADTLIRYAGMVGDWTAVREAAQHGLAGRTPPADVWRLAFDMSAWTGDAATAEAVLAAAPSAKDAEDARGRANSLAQLRLLAAEDVGAADASLAWAAIGLPHAPSGAGAGTAGVSLVRILSMRSHVDDLRQALDFGPLARLAPAFRAWIAQLARELAPDDATTNWHLGDAFLRRGFFWEAADHFTRVLGAKERSGDAALLALYCVGFDMGVSPDAAWRLRLACEHGLLPPDVEALVRSFYANTTSPDLPIFAYDGALRQPDDASLSGPMRLVRRFFVGSRFRRPRLAVCLSGQLRSYSRCWPATRAALEPFDCTVIVTTWASAWGGMAPEKAFARAIPKALSQALTENQRRLDVLGRLFPSLAAHSVQHENVTEQEIRDFYGTDHVEVEAEHDFETWLSEQPISRIEAAKNQCKMYYKIYRANVMKAGLEQQSGDVFDAVLRLRPDKRVERLDPSNVEIIQSGRVVLVDYARVAGKYTVVSDQIGLMSSATSDDYSAIWRHLIEAGTPAYFPGFTGQFADILMTSHLLASGIRYGRLDGTMANRLVGAELDMAEALAIMAGDLGTNGSDAANERAHLFNTAWHVAQALPSQPLLQAEMDRLSYLPEVERILKETSQPRIAPVLL